jgi:hypothetical protein
MLHERYKNAFHIVENLGHGPVGLWINSAADRLRLSCATLFN